MERLKRLRELAKKAHVAKKSGDEVSLKSYLELFDKEAECLGGDKMWPLRQHLETVRYALRRIRDKPDKNPKLLSRFLAGHEHAVSGRQALGLGESYLEGYSLGHHWCVNIKPHNKNA